MRVFQKGTERSQIFLKKLLRKSRAPTPEGVDSGFSGGRGFADLGFEVVVEVVEGVAEGLVALFDPAEQHASFEAADDERRSFIDVQPGSDGSGCNTFLQDLSELGLPAAEGFADALAQDGVAVVGVDGGVEQGTAAGQAGAGAEVGDVLFEAVDVVGDGVEVGGTFGDGHLPGEVEGLGGELLLAFEVAVDSALLEAGGSHDELYGAAFIAALIEDRCGLGDDALPGCLAFAHGASCWSSRNRAVSKGYH